LEQAAGEPESASTTSSTVIGELAKTAAVADKCSS
jgi:hypothetical protein